MINEIPNISDLVNSLYDCRYRDFMAAVVELNGQLEEDRYFATHSRYLVRELRILAYTQFLDAYKSVVMGTMATAFGVGEVFLDRELSRFIAAGRLNAKIDKVRQAGQGGMGGRRERGRGGWRKCVGRREREGGEEGGEEGGWDGGRYDKNFGAKVVRV